MNKGVIKTELAFAGILLTIWLIIGLPIYIFALIFIAPSGQEESMADYIIDCILISLFYISVIAALIGYITISKKRLKILSHKQKRN